MSVPRAGVIVFARMSSSRLPGKALHDFAGMPLISWVVRRAQSTQLPVALATSCDASDDPLAATVEALSIPVYRGSLDDVLGRAISCAKAMDFTLIARLCGDRPFFDAPGMRRALERLAAMPEVDMVSNLLHGSIPAGLTTEAVRVSALERAAAASKAPEHREHLTSYLYQHRADFCIDAIPAPQLPEAWRGQRFAVDTADDYAALRALARQPETPLVDVLRYGTPWISGTEGKFPAS